jgi:parvulin-like peptidyl-prolyl isomerase
MRAIFLISIFLFSVVISNMTAVSYSAEVVDRIVAVVNDEVITQSEVEESVIPFVADYRIRYGEEELSDKKMQEAREDALNRLIEEKLILQEAKKRNIKVEEADIEERIAEVKKRFSSEEEFNRAIEASGITIAKLREKYKEQIMMRDLISGLINSKVNITPTQIAAYYYAHIKSFSMPKMYRFKVLLLKPTEERTPQQTEELAMQVLDRIRSGEDFDMLVKQCSQGPHIDKGGDMGYMAEGSIIKEIEIELARLEPGETSSVIKTSSGFNIVKLIDEKEAGTKPPEEVNEIVRIRLFQREAELTLREFVNKLKEDAYIKIQ